MHTLMIREETILNLNEMAVKFPGLKFQNLNLHHHIPSEGINFIMLLNVNLKTNYNELDVCIYNNFCFKLFP